MIMSFEFVFRFCGCFAAYQQLGGDWAVHKTLAVSKMLTEL